MDIKRLHEINKSLSPIDIKGKDYVKVNERIKGFWELVGGEGRIITDLLSYENGVYIVRAYAYENKNDEKPIATGTALEKENSSFINNTSALENCETSAIGRCLGILGIGIDTDISSWEEKENADLQQTAEKKIEKKKQDALIQSIKNNHIEESTVTAILQKYGYEKIEEIKTKDYMNIVQELIESIKKEG